MWLSCLLYKRDIHKRGGNSSCWTSIAAGRFFFFLFLLPLLCNNFFPLSDVLLLPHFLILFFTFYLTFFPLLFAINLSWYFLCVWWHCIISGIAGLRRRVFLPLLKLYFWLEGLVIGNNCYIMAGTWYWIVIFWRNCYLW